MTSQRTKLRERYTLRDELGRGAMGIVYRAFDQLTGQDVAVKTILDGGGEARINQINAVRDVLNLLNHPNLIPIEDAGDFEEDGVSRPFYAMPLLTGVTLDRMLAERTRGLAIRSVIRIIRQAGLGLHAAHEKGLVHRDVKPNNIFVMEDKSVKVGDFGIGVGVLAPSDSAHTGTIDYLAPEQLDMKPPNPLSDQFSLGAVTYHSLTGRKPFTGANDREVAEEIRKHNPAPVCDWNHKAGLSLSQVVRKAMAKQPRHRYPTILEFRDALQKALRNPSPVIAADRTIIRHRLLRAAHCLDSGDLALAFEILAEVEGEGHLDDEVLHLRRRIDLALRERGQRHLIGTARHFFDLADYQQALGKAQEAVEFDPADSEARALKNHIEKETREKQIESWMSEARLHLDNSEIQKAREVLDRVLRLRPNDTGALGLIATIGSREEKLRKIADEKARLYQAAVEAWKQGDILSAFSRINLLWAMERDRPDPNHGAAYKLFCEQIQKEQQAANKDYEDAKIKLAIGDLAAALSLCDTNLSKYPGHVQFQALKVDIESRRRQGQSAAIAEACRKAEAEPDLDRRVLIFDEALKSCPDDPNLQRRLQQTVEKRDLVQSLIAKARKLEEQSRFSEALDQWQMAGSIHERQPGLAAETGRLMRLRDREARASARAHWVEQVRDGLENRNYLKAREALEGGLADFPGDAELLDLDRKLRNLEQRSAAPVRLVPPPAAPSRPESQPAADSPDEFTLWCLGQARRLQSSGDLSGASAILAQGLAMKPAEPNLLRVQAEVLRSGSGPAVQSPVALIEKSPPAPVLPPAIRPVIVVPQPPADLVKSPASKGALARPQGPRTIPMGLVRRAFQIQTEEKKSAPAVPEPGSRGPWFYAALVSAIVVIGAAVVLVWRLEQPKPIVDNPVVSKIRVGIRVQPSSAMITVDGTPCGESDCSMVLPPGLHQAHAELPGFDSASSSFSLRPGAAAPSVTLSLIPSRTSLTLMIDREATVLVDSAPPARIQAGFSETTKLDPGGHRLQIESGAGRLALEMEIAPGSPPMLTRAIETHDLRAYVITRCGSRANVYSSIAGVNVSVDGKPEQPLNVVAGLELYDLAPGTHTLSLNGLHPGDHAKLSFEAGPSSAIVASLVSDVSLGVLRVSANQDDATILLNGNKSNRIIQNGEAFIYLRPGPYRVRVEKPGFERAAEQTVEIRSGEQDQLEFMLSIQAPTGASTSPNPARPKQ